MQVEGTKQAFIALINQKGFAKRHGYDKGTVSGWKKRPVTIDKMEGILTACGSLVVQEKIWNVTRKATKKEQQLLK